MVKCYWGQGLDGRRKIVPVMCIYPSCRRKITPSGILGKSWLPPNANSNPNCCPDPDDSAR